MHRSLQTLLLVLTLFVTPYYADAADNDKDRRLGRQIPNFVLTNTKGKDLALADYPEYKLLVFVFLGTECPIGNSYIPDLNTLATKYKPQKVGFVAVNSNLSDTTADITKHAEEYDIQFPVVIDADQIAADIFGAERTPEAFILDQRRTIRLLA